MSTRTGNCSWPPTRFEMRGFHALVWSAGVRCCCRRGCMFALHAAIFNPSTTLSPARALAPTMAFGSPASRKLLLTMVLLVVGLDGIAIGLYYVLDIARRANQVQMAFIVVWTMLTLAIVLVLLHRIRQIRDAAAGRTRHRHAGPARR